MKASDLPSPQKQANLEKSREKLEDWDLKPGDFQNMCLMK